MKLYIIIVKLIKNILILKVYNIKYNYYEFNEL